MALHEITIINEGVVLHTIRCELLSIHASNSVTQLVMTSHDKAFYLQPSMWVMKNFGLWPYKQQESYGGSITYNRNRESLHYPPLDISPIYSGRLERNPSTIIPHAHKASSLWWWEFSCHHIYHLNVVGDVPVIGIPPKILLNLVMVPGP